MSPTHTDERPHRLPERRHTPDNPELEAVLRMLHGIEERVEATENHRHDVLTALNKMSGELSEHIKHEDRIITEAFPNRDVVGHRRSHEAQIAAAEAEAAFWREMRLDLAKKGAFALLALLFGLVVAGFGVAVWAQFGGRGQ